MSRAKTTTHRSPLATHQAELDLHAPLAGDLTPAELHGVARVGLQAAKVRDALEPGVHALDLAVRLLGSLVVGAPQPGGVYTETPSAERMLAILFAAASPRSRGKMLDCLKARYADWRAGDVVAEPELDLKETAIAADVYGSLGRSGLKPNKRGSVTGAIECRLIRRYGT